MPFLTVLGSGSWQPRRGARFEAGVHEVSDEIAELAVSSGIRSLVVTDVRPLLRERHEGPLTPEDFGAGGGVRITEPEALEEPEEEWDDELPVFQCPLCPEKRPSSPALKRHLEFAHDLRPQ